MNKLLPILYTCFCVWVTECDDVSQQCSSRCAGLGNIFPEFHLFWVHICSTLYRHQTNRMSPDMLWETSSCENWFTALWLGIWLGCARPCFRFTLVQASHVCCSMVSQVRPRTAGSKIKYFMTAGITPRENSCINPYTGNQFPGLHPLIMQNRLLSPVWLTGAYTTTHLLINSHSSIFIHSCTGSLWVCLFKESFHNFVILCAYV